MFRGDSPIDDVIVHGVLRRQNSSAKVFCGDNVPVPLRILLMHPASSSSFFNCFYASGVEIVNIIC
jgi:hypothetical protein